MKSKPLSLRKMLKNVSEGYTNAKPDQESFACFKTELKKLVEAAQAKPDESEEFHKNIVSDFLKSTGYKQRFSINTKGRQDLVIHNGSDAKSCVGVIFETKSPRNKNEMLTKERLNAKALHELVYYYLQERITHKNVEVKHLIATNISEWFVFDVHEFDRIFAQNKKFVQQFSDFAAGRLADTTTDFFYKQVIAPFVDSLADEVEFTHINLADYAAKLQNAASADEDSLIELYKILSPEHLLKLTFKNDSNTLNKKFYNELLYIIGLTEVGQNGKKLIERCKKGERQNGSLLENAIDGIVAYERIGNVTQYGSNTEERLFSAALELAITWVNRILFLKLLESQLLSYHQRDESYAFLTSDKIKSYDSLNDLFFRVLACKLKERHEDVKEAFAKVPYLNSSLFAPTELEKETLRISELRDDKTIAIFSDTVLKDGSKKKSGTVPLLEYLFAFLNAYDFGSERDNKFQSQDRLINASVLGLIFEKINGYKDGSFFTPGFITMYMCRETIRKAVVQKFNEVKNWNCQTLDELYDKINDTEEANEIVNSLKICDPAVGSGHFLVSALNEVIAIKHDLKILRDRSGKRLKEYDIQIVNDELAITDENGKPFAYRFKSSESQRVQEALFHEKQTIIENCLFGVDINPNSVAICRLRLWVELLKNAYYKNATELETLPNIDINIKCGNSLVSRFPLNADLKKVLKGKCTVEKYRQAVDTYRNAKSKDEKLAMERLIAEIKSSFRGELSRESNEAVALRKLKGKLVELTKQNRMFEKNKKEQTAWEKEVQQVTAAIEKQEAENEAIKASKIYANAFEWRFEFPEVLNDSGEFVGFDVIFANPPYSSKNSIENKRYRDFFDWVEYKCDPFAFFIQLAWNSVPKSGLVAFIVPVTWMTNVYYEKLRRNLIDTNSLSGAVLLKGLAFESANVDTSLLFIERESVHSRQFVWADADSRLSSVQNIFRSYDSVCRESRYDITPEVNSAWDAVRIKIEQNARKLGDFAKISLGMKLNGNDRFVSATQSKTHPDPIVFGSDISLFGKVTPARFFNFSSAEIIGGTKKPAIHHAKNKIFVQAIRNLSLNRRIVATLDDQGMYFVGTVNAIIPQEDGWDICYLLGLINSKLLNSYFCHRFTTISLTAAFLGELPIIPPDYDVKKSQEISKLVRRRLSKSANPKADTTALESEIDRLVYDLYGLDGPEIAIVEGKTA